MTTHGAIHEDDLGVGPTSASRDLRIAPLSSSPPGAQAPPLGAELDPQTIEYLREQVDNAGKLMTFAAEAGVPVADDTRLHVLEGIRAAQHGWTVDAAAKFLSALTALASKVQPVTATSLEVCSRDQTEQTETYAKWMAAIFVPLALVSIANFYASKLCEAIQNDLHGAQELAVTLNNELFRGSATDRQAVASFSADVTQLQVVEHLTQLAVLVRATKAHSEKLNTFVTPWQEPPTTDVAAPDLELEPALSQLAAETTRMIGHYQKIRLFAQTVQTDASMLYGAVVSCVLPMFYAILGALAFLMRRFEQQRTSRTFTGFDAHAAHFGVAAIGGFVVGLFNVNIAQGTTSAVSHPDAISPLALAFVVGYAVDVFFAFLETLVVKFRAPSR